jgi:hypothetical protein
MSARVMQVIVTELERRGAGVEGSPIRIIRQYWDFDGNLLAEVDPCAGTTYARSASAPAREEGGA